MKPSGSRDFIVYCCDKRFNNKYRLSTDASYLTNLTLEVARWCLSNNRNMIVAYPEPTVRPLSLLAFLSTRILGKASIVFTRKTDGFGDAVQQHVTTYSLLEDSSRNIYLYRLSPLGQLSSGRSGMILNLAIDLTRVGNRYYRKKYLETLKKDLRSSPNLIVISAENHSEVVDFLDAVKIKSRVLGEKVDLEVGSVFFENMDRMVNSRVSYQSFKEWIGDQILSENMFFFGHFANTYSPFLNRIAKDTGAVVLHLGSSLMLNNSDILIPGYLDDLDSTSQTRLRRGNTISSVSLDSSDVWSGRKPPKIVLPHAQSGNLDSLLESLRKRSHHIMSKGSKEIRLTIGPLVRQLRRMPRLTVHPHRLRFRYKFDTGEWRTLDFDFYLEMVTQRISSIKKSEIKVEAQSFLREFKTLCQELNQSARYDDETWERKGKPYRVVRFVSEWLGTHREKSLIIAVSDFEERRLLLNDVREHFGQKDVEVRLIQNLAMSVASPRNRELVLPFPLSIRNFSEYLKPYDRIHMVVYEGREAKLAEEHVKLVGHVDTESEMISCGHLRITLEEMGKDLTRRYLYQRILEKEELAREVAPETTKELETAEVTEIERDPLEKRIHRLLEKKEVFPLSHEENELEEESEALEVPMEMEDEEITGDRVELGLRCMKTQEIREVSLRRRRPVVTTKKEVSREILEVPAEQLEEGSYVVLPFGEARRDMTDILVDMFSEDKDVDTELLTYWKETLCDYKSENGLSYRELHDEYEEIARSKGIEPREYQTMIHWTKEWRIAPLHTEDLTIIGEMTEDEFLVENADNTSDDAEKLRALRRWIGRLMNKVLKEVLIGGGSSKEKSYEEATLASMVRKSLYEVISVKHIND